MFRLMICLAGLLPCSSSDVRAGAGESTLLSDTPRLSPLLAEFGVGTGGVRPVSSRLGRGPVLKGPGSGGSSGG